jgi:phage gp45-like
VDNGAKIVLKANGEILIEGKKITFDAGNGDIELKARSVDVQVTSEMNVH